MLQQRSNTRTEDLAPCTQRKAERADICTRLALVLALAAQCALAGCHGQAAAPVSVEDEVTAEQVTASQAESDQTNLVFAQQEVDLARANEDLVRGQGGHVDPTATNKAEAHLHAAQLVMKMDQDRAQVAKDATEWKNFATSPAMR